jgi:two-component sensor histidine kinase
VAVPANTVVSLSLALHELATNALKYGALSVPAGRVSLSWRLVGKGAGRRLLLRWAERGGPPVTPPEHRGFGSRLIEQALGPDLGGEVRLAFEPTGVVCEIEAPAPPADRRQAAPL